MNEFCGINHHVMLIGVDGQRLIGTCEVVILTTEIVYAWDGGACNRSLGVNEVRLAMNAEQLSATSELYMKWASEIDALERKIPGRCQ